ncbi:MAG: hypothetical protein ABI833_06760, partial [Acidobacteriota bacterium]
MVVVADTSPIDYLVLIAQIELLRQLYNRILISPGCASLSGFEVLAGSCIILPIGERRVSSSDYRWSEIRRLSKSRRRLDFHWSVGLARAHHRGKTVTNPSLLRLLGLLLSEKQIPQVIENLEN